MMKKLFLLSLLVMYIALPIFKKGPITGNEAIWWFMLVPFLIAIFFIIIEVIINNKKNEGMEKSTNSAGGKIKNVLFLSFGIFLLSGVFFILGSTLSRELRPGNFAIIGIFLFWVASLFLIIYLIEGFQEILSNWEINLLISITALLVMFLGLLIEKRTFDLAITVGIITGMVSFLLGDSKKQFYDYLNQCYVPKQIEPDDYFSDE